MIRKLKSGLYRLYSRKKNEKTGKRRNLGSFATREEAENTSARSNISNVIDLDSTPLPANENLFAAMRW